MPEPYPHLFHGERVRLARPQAEDATVVAQMSDDGEYRRWEDTSYARGMSVEEARQLISQQGQDGKSILFHLRTIPEDWRHASLGLGATRWQTMRRVIFRQALPGMIASVVLGTSRAFGETMAVLMVVGNVPQVPTSIFDAAYPLPALIANNYGEMMSIPLYDAALLGAALILLVMILVFNIASTLVLQRMMGRNWV